jgi:4-amino-4-deoxy-L-arabinose transferase-like glycosyltransferase
LPLSSVPLYLLFGPTRLAAHLATGLLPRALPGRWLLARRAPRRPAGALLAAFLLGSFTATLNLSRDYQMDFPAAALLTLALVALDRSRGLSRAVFVAAFGAFAGLALVAKTVSGVFLAGPLLWTVRDARLRKRRGWTCWSGCRSPPGRRPPWPVRGGCGTARPSSCTSGSTASAPAPRPTTPRAADRLLVLRARPFQ